MVSVDQGDPDQPTTGSDYSFGLGILKAQKELGGLVCTRGQ